MTSSVGKRVLVIQDAATELSVHAIRWAVQYLYLQPGDKIKLLRVVQPFRTTAEASSSSCWRLVGNKLHSSVTILKRKESLEKEIAKKLDEYDNNVEMKEILKLMENKQIEIEKVVESGHSLKETTVAAVNSFDATSVILDRKLKHDQKYIMDMVTCEIWRVKRDRGFQYVRAPKLAEPIREQQDVVVHQSSICSVCMNTRPMGGTVRDFTFGEMQFATSGFSEQNLLSHNRKVLYRGSLSNGMRIVVRRRSLETITEMEFKSRVQLFGKLRHENVAVVLGSSSEGPERLLVYEYVCNGSLNAHLSNNSQLLTWERRLKIATGTARGLQYLHSKSFYGSMRPTNILITHDFVPLLTNYGITRNQYEDLDRYPQTRVLKTFEYLAPEYEQTGTDSSKSDVYSFGVVLLELITGRKSIQETNGRSFLRWAKPLLRDKCYVELLDPTVPDSPDVHQLLWLVRLAEACLTSDPYRRYSIDMVVSSLTRINQGEPIEGYSPPESE